MLLAFLNTEGIHKNIQKQRTEEISPVPNKRQQKLNSQVLQLHSAI